MILSLISCHIESDSRDRVEEVGTFMSPESLARSLISKTQSTKWGLLRTDHYLKSWTSALSDSRKCVYTCGWGGIKTQIRKDMFYQNMVNFKETEQCKT